ncbi:hypothetical protein [Pontibacillus halophilus]|uniref:hypothetical protein n=1 Tax=Pontibacillus halophilus TaxID=516704 RepID=UPI00047E747C|nr:hypothetical protein [Pontibacillus halophilus]
MLKKPFIADEKTYLSKDGKQTLTVFHPAIYYSSEKAYCYFPDENTSSGLVEHNNEKDALRNAEILYKHYITEKY